MGDHAVRIGVAWGPVGNTARISSYQVFHVCLFLFFLLLVVLPKKARTLLPDYRIWVPSPPPEGRLSRLIRDLPQNSSRT